MKKSFIDKIFVLVFLLCLFIPIFNFKETNVQARENRTITKYSRTLANFENYISDRFCFRYQLISLNRNIRYFLTQNYYTDNGTVFDKKNNLLYTSSFWGKRNKNINYDIIIENIKRFNEYCNSKDIKLYLLIIPRRSDFIKYNSYKINLQKNSNVFDNGEKIVKILKADTDVSVVYPYKEMITENVINPVYYKTDHHWSDSGIYVSYVALMNEIRKTYPDIAILNKTDFKITRSKKVNFVWNSKFHNGTLLRNLGVSDSITDKILDTEYLYYEHPDIVLFKNSKGSNPKKLNINPDTYFHYPKGYDKKVLLIGDSFASGFLKFLPYSFKETVHFADNQRYMAFSAYKDSIEKYNPDIIIIVMRSYYTGMFANLYKEKGK